PGIFDSGTMAVYGAETCFALAANACLGMSQGLGPATKFIPIVREELAACRGNTLIMVVEDDRVYPRDALETSSITISNCTGRLSVFAVQRCRELWTGVTPG